MRPLLALVMLVAVAVRVTADDPKKPDYYPLRKGDRWEYEVTRADDKKETKVLQVIDTEMKEGKLIASVKDPRFTSTYTYRVDEKEIVQLTGDGLKYDPPIPRLRFPLKNGEKWSLNRKIGGETIELAWVVGAPVEVTVPAGKFKAIPVVYTEVVGGLKVTNTLHCADGIGLVRREAVFFLGTATEELTKFTPGK